MLAEKKGPEFNLEGKNMRSEVLLNTTCSWKNSLTAVPVLVLLILPWSAFGQEKKLSEGEFTSAEVCGGCHTEIFNQWSQSMHSRSFSDPVYRAVIEEMIKETGGRQQRFCLTCHAPDASVTGQLDELPTPLDSPP